MHNLIKTKEFYETVDLIITPIILVNNATECQYVNKAFLSQIGYNIKDVRNPDSWFNKVYQDENYRRDMKRKGQKGLKSDKNKAVTHAHMVTNVCCADGSFKWFDIHESIFGNNKLVTFLDVDELKRSNNELTDFLKQKDTLLSILAHDVRSPLSNIKQIVNSYKSLNLSENEVEEVFFSMGTQIDYIFNIINSLLVHTSLDRGSFIEKRELIHLNRFFTKYEVYYNERMEKQNIDFVFELPANATVNFDPFILDVICRNLIDNAIKYSSENGNVYISFEKKADAMVLIIRDTGPGMSAIQREHILINKGSRRLKSDVTDGFGVGLIMSKEILEKHHGELLIESEPGKGTSFIILLPSA